MIGPPAVPIQGGSDLFNAALPTDVTLTIATPSTGDSALFLADSGWRWEHVAAGGETAEDVRDALLVAMTTDPTLNATITAQSTDQIRIVTTAPGDLVNPLGFGLVTVAISTEVFCQVQIDQLEALIEVEAYSTNKTPRGGAHRALQSLLRRAQTQEPREVLGSYGLSARNVSSAVPRKLDDLSGPDWQSRSSATIRMAWPSLFATPRDTIQTIGLGLVTRQPTTTTTIEVTP